MSSAFALFFYTRVEGSKVAFSGRYLKTRVTPVNQAHGIFVAESSHQAAANYISYGSGGATSRGQEIRRQAAWKSIEETYGAIRSGGVQHHHPSGSSAQGTGPDRHNLVHRGHSTRPSSRYGDERLSPRTFRNACTVWTDPQRLKGHSEGEKTVISRNTSVTCSTAQHYHWLEDHEERQQLLPQQRHPWAASREGKLSDYGFLEELRKITTSVTTGKQQVEGDASCVITGAITDKLV